MQGMILAAGMGKRLRELTKDNTKCMVQVNGVTLIERMLRQLDALHLSRIVIVTGYKGQKLRDFIGTLSVRTPVFFEENPVYDKTNNIYSLFLAKDWLLKDDTILLESDLIFEDSVLQTLAEDPRDSLVLVDKYESYMDGTCIKIGENDSIEELVTGKKLRYDELDQYYKTVNVYKFSREFSETHYVPFLTAYCKALGNNEYYEQVLRVIAMLEEPGIYVKKLQGQRWYEIDDVQDLDIAESIFAPDEDVRLIKMQSRYGGYWRYPDLLDFCYLVNPYFPPKRMLDEIRSNFDALLTEYPSGMRVNSLLAGRNFDVKEAHILVGNGAAELIRDLLPEMTGRFGIIRPTFEEYPNRLEHDQCVEFFPENDDFSYTADDLMTFFDKTGIRTLIVINPDNPSGNYIPKGEMLRLSDWCEKKEIRLIVDESFADFSEEEDETLISEEILARFPHLILIKSISKSYGVPGIRLGILVSGDEELVASLKKSAAIWNINSFAECFMQIFDKYQKDYREALERFKSERTEFLKDLSGIPGLRVFPTQANFVMAEVTSGMPARTLTKTLLTKKNILIKDLTAKVSGDGRQYIRLAVRKGEENRLLVKALSEVLGHKEPD